MCAGGCVQYGETDHDNALRELHEEYGIKGVDINSVFTLKVI